MKNRYILTYQTLHPFINELVHWTRWIYPAVKKYFRTKFVSPSSTSYPKEETFFWQIVQDYPLRKGKYFRPTLLILSCQAAGGDYRKTLNTTVAYQLSEDWILVHDDIEDNSYKRRGDWCLHHKYTPALAINAGDVLQMMMWYVLSKNQPVLGTKLTLKIWEEFYYFSMRTALGQMTEIRWTEQQKLNFTLSDYYYLVDGKTSYYTCAGPLRLGAMIAGVNHPISLNRLFKLGLYLGRCYQIIDDVLDVTSDFQGRKIRGTDVREGKVTILLYHLLNSVPEKVKRKILNIYRKNPACKTDKEINFILDLLDTYGSIDFARRTAQEFADKSITELNKIKFYTNETVKDKIRMAIDFVYNRKY